MSSILELEHLYPMSTTYRHLSVVPSLARTPQRQPKLRLTARGRMVVMVGAVLILGLLAVAFGPSTVASNQAGAPVPAKTVMVEPGQTIWDLAAEANPSGDVRDTVADIMRLNSIESASALQAGDTIAIPLYK